jgi:hypothetical protein
MRKMLMLLLCLCSGTLLAAEGKGPLKVFILAGDENCLEQAPIDGSVSVPRKGDIKGVTVTNRIGALGLSEGRRWRMGKAGRCGAF